MELFYTCLLSIGVAHQPSGIQPSAHTDSCLSMRPKIIYYDPPIIIEPNIACNYINIYLDLSVKC